MMHQVDLQIAAAPLPTPRTIRHRMSFPLQLLRFAWLNMRILGMVHKAH